MPAKYLYNSKIQAISVFILVLILIILSIQVYGKTFREGGNDFTSYLLSSQAFWNGDNPYLIQSPYPYIYPLFLTVILIPFVYLPLVLSTSVFLLINVLLLFCSFFIVVKYYTQEKTFFSALTLPLLLLTVFLLGVIQNNLLNGQINIIVLFFTVLFLVFYLKERPVEASIILSISIAIKLTPLIFIFFLIRRKEYKIIFLTILFSLIFILGIPYLVQGNNIAVLYQDYFQKIKELSSSTGLLVKSKIFTLNDFVAFFMPSLRQVIWFKYFCAAVVIASLFFMDKGNLLRNSRKEILIFSIYSTSVLLISPMSETHHLIVILPALSIITYVIFFSHGIFNSLRTILLVAFISSFFFSLILKVGLFYFIAFVLLIILIFSFYRSANEPGKKIP